MKLFTNILWFSYIKQTNVLDANMQVLDVSTGITTQNYANHGSIQSVPICSWISIKLLKGVRTNFSMTYSNILQKCKIAQWNND